MDYGKLAYLKAVDLEERLGKEKSSEFGITVREFNDLPAGRQQVIKIYGEGGIAVFVNSTQSGVFYVDGVKISEGNNIFFKLTGGGEISVESNGIAKLKIMIIGNIISSEKPGTLFADYIDSIVAYVVFNQGVATAKYYDGPELIELFSGQYVHGDVCFYGGHMLFAMLDETGKIEIAGLDGDWNEYRAGASRIAMVADDNFVRIAFIRDGELYFIEFNDINNAVFVENKIPFPGVVDDLRFVKKSSKLLFSSGGKCYVKDLGISIKKSDKLYVEFGVERI